ncbi:MAG: LamB/YcsF family protein [Algoriphagus sp.]|uniref:LamB/YcsF family protein n=1 Tax=Algoriphagus sp. TaxID=1872435 RepID=UPI00183B7B59|nr:LamB/YcsF family protein [Algoriphagus sp.]NVJ85659.1 LamB/YcsF family protein [Algoriphagus sp.]
MKQRALEINSDLGEGVLHEEKIIPYIDTASIACGGHFGNRESIYQTLNSCLKSGKKGGAHPSYPDKENFGRRSLSITTEALIDSIHEQIGLFLEVAKELDMPMDHIKFHGALYNDAASQPDLASSLCEYLSNEFPSTTIFVPPFSAMENAAKENELIIRREVFGDRAYTDDLQLLSRKEKGAVLTDFESVSEHLQLIIEESKIRTISGKLISVQADTICFHGDNAGILDFLPQIRKKWWT